MLADIGWWVMGIATAIRKITRPAFQLDPEQYVLGYEDKDSPCTICILKVVCTIVCQDLYDYGKEIQRDINRLGKKWAPDKFQTGLSASSSYSVANVMQVLKTIKGSLAEDMFHNDEMHESIQRAQYHLNRKRIILKNYVNKFGRGISSSTQSGRSSSSASSTQSRKAKGYGTNPRNIKGIPGQPQKLNQHSGKRNPGVHRQGNRVN